MRMSCNGCRVLRKGCSEDCTIRPCLDWIKNPEFQGNATVFLSKFYGRAGLLNLIAAGPDHLRPAIFRSLLYEACGRMVDPIYGPVGLLWSGNWHLCQAAVEAVLHGKPIQIQSNVSIGLPIEPLKSFDIRHVTKSDKISHILHKVPKNTSSRFKPSTQTYVRQNPKSMPVNVPRHELLASLVADQGVLAGGSTEVELELTLGSSGFNGTFGK